MRRLHVLFLFALFFGGFLCVNESIRADDDPDDLASEDRDGGPLQADRRPSELGKEDGGPFDRPQRRNRRHRGDGNFRDAPGPDHDPFHGRSRGGKGTSREDHHHRKEDHHHRKLREMFGRHINPERNPEMFEVVQKDFRLERVARNLAHEYKQADSAEREQLRGELMSTVNEHFEIRQQLRELRLNRLREELNRLEAAIERRNEARDAIIGRRMAELTGEDDDLNF